MFAEFHLASFIIGGSLALLFWSFSRAATADALAWSKLMVFSARALIILLLVSIADNLLEGDYLRVLSPILLIIGMVRMLWIYNTRKGSSINKKPRNAEPF